MTAADVMRVLDRRAVVDCLERIDPVEVVLQTLMAHAHGRTLLPAEGYLSWTNQQGAYSRSLAMLGGINDQPVPQYGLKVVNASTSNPTLGIERAGGLLMLFDSETARPRVLAEAGLISALRTAAYTVLSVQAFGPERIDSLSIIGCGTLARTHLNLLSHSLPDLKRVYIYDLISHRAAELIAWAAEKLPALEVIEAPDPRSCVEASQVLLTTTVSNRPYISEDWFVAPTLIAHVSLDDVDRSVFENAQAIIVDDVDLVVDNPRRVLGSLVGEGVVSATPHPNLPSIAGTLGDILVGRLNLARPTQGNIVSNPFGMAILDVALLGAVSSVAQEVSVGENIDLVGTAR